MAATVPVIEAQPVSLVTVQSNPDGPWFDIDGTVFYHAQSTFWPQGSVHNLSVPSGTGYAYDATETTQWQFQNWQYGGNTSSSTSIQVIADPSITKYTAVYTAQYMFTYNVACNPAPCSAAPGAISINGSLPVPSGNSWEPPNAGLTLQASWNNGWIFAGWQVGSNPLVTSAIYAVSIASPTTVTAIFIPAAPINISTIPAKLQVYADHTLLSTPGTLYWGLGTNHTLGGLPVTQDTNGKSWVFASWSDGGAANHTYVVPNSPQAQNVVATYAAAASPAFYTVPPNLNLVVDGVVLPPPYTYIWGVGSTHTVTAPTTNTDAQGNVWTFQSWDDQVTTPTRTFTIPVGADVNGFRMTALYTSQTGKSQLTILSNLSGVSVTVDGTACATPCTVSRTAGTQVHVSATPSIAMGPGSRQDFLGWSSGGAPVAGDWVGTLSAASTTITANYHQMNLLSASSNPNGGASWTIQPASSDGYYDSQAAVNVGVSAQPGFRFNNWSGDLTGSAANGVLTMSVPHAVTAQFSLVPYIAPGGVMNGAGAGPQPGVAPGSVASIYGLNLASSTAVGPASPMVQTLAGATVHIGSRQLPLYFASPTQLNLQIPPDLALGPQTITVSSPGMPDVGANFTVVRNAPGLFSVNFNGQTYALVLHQDGTLVSPASPAQKGETLTAYATGLGPTSGGVLEGILVPDTPPFLVLDPVSIQLGQAAYTPQASIAAPGTVGLNIVQFQLDNSAPSGTNIPFTLTVNGVNSNTVNLSIQ